MHAIIWLELYDLTNFIIACLHSALFGAMIDFIILYLILGRSSLSTNFCSNYHYFLCTIRLLKKPLIMGSVSVDDDAALDERRLAALFLSGVIL